MPRVRRHSRRAAVVGKINEQPCKRMLGVFVWMHVSIHKPTVCYAMATAATATSVETLDALDRFVYVNFIDEKTRKYVQVQHLAPLIAAIKGEIVKDMRDLLCVVALDAIDLEDRYEIEAVLNRQVMFPPCDNGYMRSYTQWGDATCRELVALIDALPSE